MKRKRESPASERVTDCAYHQHQSHDTSLIISLDIHEMFVFSLLFSPFFFYSLFSLSQLNKQID
jgi:hypothetical protein